ncbi:MAG: hypothetical protein ACKVQA_01220 [Burkholderiales bacterium]
MPAVETKKEALLLNFKKDTLTTVSRGTLRNVASALGFSETQAVHFALARLRDEALRLESEQEYPSLTKQQLAAVREQEPKRKGRVLSTLLR